MLVLVDDGGLGNGVGLALPLANALVLWVEASGLGRLGRSSIPKPLIGLGVPCDAHAATNTGRSRCRYGTWWEKETKTDGDKCVTDHLATWTNLKLWTIHMFAPWLIL